MNKKEINEIKKQIIIFIKDNNITEYHNLLDILANSDLTNMLDVAMNHTILFNTYLCSYRNDLRDSLSSAGAGSRVTKKH